MTAPQEPTLPSELFTPFLPATYSVPEEPDKVKTFLVDTFSNITDVLNDKKIGTYTQDTENFNGEVWGYDTTKKTRNGYQIIKRFTSFVSGTYDMPLSDVNPQWRATLIYGTASKPCSAVNAGDGDFFSFMAQGDTRISFTMSDTKITITATAPMANYDGYIIINYLRDGD
jgi:hypothetical protein